MAARHRIHDVTLKRRFDAIEANAVATAPHQRDVFRMRPAKGHRRPCRPAALIPPLGRSSASQTCSASFRLRWRRFQRLYMRHRIPPGSQLVMAALTR